MKPRVVLAGSGGHAKVIIEILEQRAEMEIAGFTSVESLKASVFGYPIIGSDDELPRLFESGVRHAFPAIGDNQVRLRVLHTLNAAGFTVINAVSCHSMLSARAVLGRGIAVMPGAVINVASTIGDGTIVNTGATIDHDCSIGECVHVSPGTTLAASVSVGQGTFLGIGCRIIPGIKIGSWAIVGAGAVVIHDVDDGVTAVGVPARAIKRAGRKMDK